MKKRCLLPLLLGVVVFAAPGWAAAGSSPGARTGDSSLLLPADQDVQLPAQQPSGVVPVVTRGALPLSTVELGRVSVAMDFLMEQTEITSGFVDDGVGLMFTITRR